MRFWDTSALVPLCVTEPATKAARGLADADPSLVVWWASRTECISAFERRRREGRLDGAATRRARQVLTALSGACAEVLPSEAVRARAERLLAVHHLRAADAFQLAAALLWARGETATHALVSLDARVRDAAQHEGFIVLP